MGHSNRKWRQKFSHMAATIETWSFHPAGERQVGGEEFVAKVQNFLQ